MGPLLVLVPTPHQQLWEVLTRLSCLCTWPHGQKLGNQCPAKPIIQIVVLTLGRPWAGIHLHKGPRVAWLLVVEGPAALVLLACWTSAQVGGIVVATIYRCHGNSPPQEDVGPRATAVPP